MTEAEIEARATVMVETFLSNAVESEISAEAKTEFIFKVAGQIKQGVEKIGTLVMPAAALLFGYKIIAPWLCEVINGGYPCEFFLPGYRSPGNPMPPAYAYPYAEPVELFAELDKNH